MEMHSVGFFLWKWDCLDDPQETPNHGQSDLKDDLWEAGTDLGDGGTADMAEAKRNIEATRQGSGARMSAWEHEQQPRVVLKW